MKITSRYSEVVVVVVRGRDSAGWLLDEEYIVWAVVGVAIVIGKLIEVE